MFILCYFCWYVYVKVFIFEVEDLYVVGLFNINNFEEGVVYCFEVIGRKVVYLI